MVKMLPISDQWSATAVYWSHILALVPGSSAQFCHIGDPVLCGNESFQEKTELFQIGSRHWNTRQSQTKEVVGVTTSEKWNVLSAGHS